MDYDKLAQETGGKPSQKKDVDYDVLAQETKQPAGALSRFGQGLAEPVTGASQLLYNVLPESVQRAGDRINNMLADMGVPFEKIPEGQYNELIQQKAQEYQETAPEGVDWARIAGNVASPVNLIPAAAGMKLATTAGGRIAQGAGLGAFAGATTPITEGEYSKELGKNVALGAALGAAGSGVGEGVARVISPKASTNPMVQALKNQDVEMTPGQVLGGRFGINEEKLASIPILGDKIAARRNEAITAWNRAMLNKAGESIGFKTNKTGVDAITDLNSAVKNAYNKAVEASPVVQIDEPFVQSLQKIREMAATQAFAEPAQKAVDLNIKRMVSGIEPNGRLLPETWKKIDSELGQILRKAKDPQFQDAIRELQKQWRGLAGRSNPEQAKLFRAADQAYYGLERLTNATYRKSQDMGEFTPSQLFSAAKKGVSKASLKEKKAPFVTEAMEAQEILGNRVPNSGTFDRAILPAILAGSVIDPSTALLVGAGASAYTRPGAKLLTEAITRRPDAAVPLARALQSSSPALGLIAAQPAK